MFDNIIVVVVKKESLEVQNNERTSLGPGIFLNWSFGGGWWMFCGTVFCIADLVPLYTL